MAQTHIRDGSENARPGQQISARALAGTLGQGLKMLMLLAQSLGVSLLALLLDALLGEPRRFHPLVGFGGLAQRLERRLNRATAAPARQKVLGVLAVCIAVLPLIGLVVWLREYGLAFLVDAVALYLAVGWRSLREHARPVAQALQAGQLVLAREQVGRMVSRDTQQMQAQDVAKAALESVLENGNDALFGAWFWCLVLGAPGVVMYRLVNTLDAMWGYRNARFLHFGWAAAKLDDVLNYLPARLTALSYALLSHSASAMRCWQSQAPLWDSPNAGPVMAAGAGGLQLMLGGSAYYEGRVEDRPHLGCGRLPEAQDIDRALGLLFKVVCLWLGLMALGLLFCLMWEVARGV